MHIKHAQIYVLAALAVSTLIALCVLVLSETADTDVKLALVVQLATVLTLIVQAIRNVPQGEAMAKMVDHLANTTPTKAEKSDD